MYYVIELQTNDEAAAIVTTFGDIKEARSKYFNILEYACKSNVKKHGAVLLDENGFSIEPARVFDHTVNK